MATPQHPSKGQVIQMHSLRKMRKALSHLLEEQAHLNHHRDILDAIVGINLELEHRYSILRTQSMDSRHDQLMIEDIQALEDIRLQLMSRMDGENLDDVTMVHYNTLLLNVV